jgi:uridine phosphorylase
VGAPFAAATLEELIGLGGHSFICVGGAGVLDSSIPLGQVMIPTEALRDEGTSYHYQKRGRFSRPHPAAVRALREACRARGQTAITIRAWTTDAVYRETSSMVERRRAEGCRAVEMEAAAFFAVARFRNVVLGLALYAGDDVSGETWRHRDWSRQRKIREDLFALGVEACRRLPLESS